MALILWSVHATNLISYRSMENFENESFIRDLKNVPWESPYIFENVDDAWSRQKALFNEVLDSRAPVKRIRVRGDQLPWITPEIKLEISRHSRLYRAFRKNRSAENWAAFKRQRNKVTSRKRKALRSYFVSAKSNQSSPREFWRKLTPLLPNTRGFLSSKITLVEGGQVHNNPQEVAEIV